LLKLIKIDLTKKHLASETLIALWAKRRSRQAPPVKILETELNQQVQVFLSKELLPALSFNSRYHPWIICYQHKKYHLGFA